MSERTSNQNKVANSIEESTSYSTDFRCINWKQWLIPTTIRNKQKLFSLYKASSDCSSMLQLCQGTNWILEGTEVVLSAALRNNTGKNYGSDFKKYISFCNQRKTNPLKQIIIQWFNFYHKNSNKVISSPLRVVLNPSMQQL